jgi:small-conductance mechanosensitive channel
MPDIGSTLTTSFNDAFYAVVNFTPKFLAGAIIFIIGIVVASILKQVVLSLFRALKLESFLKKYGVPEMKDEFTWANILSEIVRWFVIIVFLIPTADVWGLPRIITVLNEFLNYLPNVFVAAVIAMVGFVFARLSHDVILASAKGVDNQTATAIASVARWAINVFVILAVLSQLGVATDLIKILFTGLVAMLAIAGGIAFGLGGQNTAKDVVEGLRKKFK